MEMAWTDDVAKRKAGPRALFVVLFPCLIPAAWDVVALISNGTCHSPSFSCSWISCHSAGSALLEAAVPRPLAAALPWPRPSWAAVEMSLCLGNIFCLVFHGRESFSLSLQTFSWADFYLHYQFQEVILESQPMWTLTRHDRASSALSPCLASVSRMGSPCRLQGSALQSPVSPTICRPSVFVLFLGLQPAHMLFGQDPIFLVFEESRGKIKLSACMQNTDPHWSTALLTFCFGKFTVSVQHFSFELLLTLVLVGWNSQTQWFHKYSVDIWGPQLSNKREKCFSLCVRTELIWVKKTGVGKAVLLKNKLHNPLFSTSGSRDSLLLRLILGMLGYCAIDRTTANGHRLQ